MAPQTPAGDGQADGVALIAGSIQNAAQVCRRICSLQWDGHIAPNYYKVVGVAQLDRRPDQGTAVYAPLDELGRATGVVACVDYSMMESGSNRPRANMSGIEPSGWGFNAEVDIELPTGETYRGQFWNRSHLLAKSLGGQEEPENLVCGTRMQNVGANLNGMEGGMAYPETLARNWLYANPEGYLYYAATPVYLADEPVCRAVVVDVLSSDGTLDAEVMVYNAAKGYSIDYATGEFWVE